MNPRISSRYLRTWLLPAVMVLFAAACSSKSPSGVECWEDEDCPGDGYTCVSNICVDLDDLSDAEGDGGEDGADDDGSGGDTTDATDVEDTVPDPGYCLESHPEALTLVAPAPGVGALSSVRINNCGETSVVIESFDFDGAEGLELLQEGGLSVGRGEDATLRVRFSADEPVEIETALYANLAGGDRVELSAIHASLEAVEGACVSASPSTVDFGEGEVGDELSAETTISNCGTVALTFDEAALWPSQLAAFDASEWADALEPGDTRDLSFALTPDHAGSFSELVELVFADEDGETAELQIFLSAQITGEAEHCISWQPAVMELDSWVAGEEPSSATATLSNCGTETLTLDSLESDDFLIAIAEEEGASIEPGAELEVAVNGATGLAPGSYTGRVIATSGDASTAGLIVSFNVEAPQDLPCLQALPGPQINFGEVSAGSEQARDFEILNCGSLPVTLSLEAADGDIEVLTIDDLPSGELAPGESFPALARADTGSLGEFSASWLVSDDRGANLQMALSVEVSDREPPCLTAEVLEDTPIHVPFGGEAHGTIRFENCSDEDVFVSNFRWRSPQPFVDTLPSLKTDDPLSPNSALLEPGESVDLNARVPGREAGLLQLGLSVTAEYEGAPSTAVDVEASLDVMVEQPGTVCVGLSTPSIDFGTLEEGSDALSVVDVTNCGQVSVTLSAATVVVDARSEGVFTVETADGFTRVLAAGARTSVSITAHDVAAAARGSHSGQVVITGTSADGDDIELPVNLDVTLPGGQQCLSVSPELIDGETVLLGATQDWQVEVSNCGNTPARVVRASFLTDSFGFSAALPPAGERTLQPGESLEVTVSLDAQSPGLLQDTLQIESGAGPDGQTVVVEVELEISVEEPQSCLDVEPAGFDFGSVTVGDSAQAQLELTNCGEMPLKVSTIRFLSGGALFDYEFVGSGERVILPGESADLDVSFAPDAHGPASAQLELVASPLTSGPPATMTLELSGEGYVPVVCLEWLAADLDFGDLQNGEAASKEATLHNCGNVDLSGISISLQPADVGWALPAGADDFALAAGASRAFSIAFESADVGSHSATLAAASDAAQASIALSATVLPPELCYQLSEAALDFGTAVPGEAIELSVEITNCGDEPFTLSFNGFLPSVTVFNILNAPAAGELELAAGASVEFDFRALSNTAGNFNAEYLFGIDSPDTSAEVRLPLGIQIPIPPVCLNVSPEALVWEDISGMSAIRRMATITNCGHSPATISSVQLVDGDESFYIHGGDSQIPVLQPGERHQVDVRNLVGLDHGIHEGLLTIVGARSDGIGSPMQIDVMLAANVTPPFTCLSHSGPDADIDFGEVMVGDSATKRFTIYNCGNTNVWINSYEITAGAPFDVLDFVPRSVSLPPGIGFSWDAKFAPLAEGPYSASLEVFGEGADPVTFNLEGVALPAAPVHCVEVKPSSLDFGYVQAGSSVNRSFLVSNCGNVDATINEMSIDGSEYFSFVNPALADGFNVAPGETRPIPVRLSGLVGAFSATVSIDVANSDDEPIRTVDLSGTISDSAPCPTMNLRGSTRAQGPFGSPIFARSGAELTLDVGLSRPLEGGEAISWSFLSAPGGQPEPQFDLVGDGSVANTTLVAPGEYRIRAQFMDAVLLGDGCDVEDILDVVVTESTGIADGLRVVMTWDAPANDDPLSSSGPDVDLHLARISSGRVYWNSADDIYYANRTADWGVFGDPSDDPELTHDDTQGFGPEILVHPYPARHESYLLGAYYWNDRGMGHSDVTFRIFRDDVELLSFSRPLNETGDFWLAARIDLEGDIITVLTEPNHTGFPQENHVPAAP